MTHHISVVIPCYKVKKHILDVLSNIGKEVESIFVVDDCCPEKSGEYVRANCHDPRVNYIFNKLNLGVGGAVMEGYRAAAARGATVIVKIDGDGQMDPRFIPLFTQPILNGDADYTKGNRFHNLEDVKNMPITRLLGNAGLSFFTKFSSGYWNIFDPTNGYTALHSNLISYIPLAKIHKRYFFESDILFRLNTMRAKVLDIPMTAKYGTEESNLSVSNALFEFMTRNTINGFKRIFYNYFLRDFSAASVEFVSGFVFLIFGVIFGLYEWYDHVQQHTLASTGTVMLAVLPIITGFQLIISFINHDVMVVPTVAIHSLLVEPKSLAE